MDDATLVAQIAARDERAMEALSERFERPMFAVALRISRNERLAEEVVQDSLMAVWRDPSRYDPARGALGPWLLTLTRYKAIDAVRRQAVIQRHSADVDLEFREAPDDVHNEVWLGIRRERLYEAIATLGSDQRRALELAFIGGLTHVEVAEREGIPLGTAKTRIRSALLKLREALGPAIGVEEDRPTVAPDAGPAGAGGARRPQSMPRPATASEVGTRSAGRAPPIRGVPANEPEASPSTDSEAPVHAQTALARPALTDLGGNTSHDQHECVEERPHA